MAYIGNYPAETQTVDFKWQSVQTSAFSAVTGKGYFVNTTSGAVTVTLPASPSAGDIIAVADYANTWQTNAVTICRNSSKLGGVCANASLSTQGQSITLVYVDATEGWKNVQDSTSNVTGLSFMSATGGTVTTCGNYKIHTFTSDSTFCVSALSTNPSYNNVDYLVVAGGGGGGGNRGGGGGAGGYRESYNPCTSGSYSASPLATPTSLPVSVQSYPITVGGGGSGGSTPPVVPGGSGVNSIFSTITSAGGGGGAPQAGTAIAGGSGGGAQGLPCGGLVGGVLPAPPVQGEPP